MKYVILAFFIFFCLTLPQSVCCKTLTLAVVSDVNYSISDKESKDGVKALRGFVSRANENNYDMTVFLGDNLAKSNANNLLAFLDEVKNINNPYYLVMGNQDVHKISGLSKEDYLRIVSAKSKYQKDFGASYSFCPTKEILVVVLDGVSSGMPSNHGVFTTHTLKWLDNLLYKNQDKKVFIFQHVPYVEPYDKKGYNMLNKQDYYAVLRRHKNIMFILSGHYHQEYTVTDEYGVTHILAPALCKYPFYYYELKIEYDKNLFSKPTNFRFDGNIRPAI